MAKKNITIDDLAVMVQKGFNAVDKRFDGMATKTELSALHNEMNKRFDGVVTKAEMNRRFDGLEDRVLASHQKRIEKLEAEVKELRGMLAV